MTTVTQHMYNANQDGSDCSIVSFDNGGIITTEATTDCLQDMMFTSAGGAPTVGTSYSGSTLANM